MWDKHPWVLLNWMHMFWIIRWQFFDQVSCMYSKVGENTRMFSPELSRPLDNIARRGYSGRLKIHQCIVFSHETVVAGSLCTPVPSAVPRCGVPCGEGSGALAASSGVYTGQAVCSLTGTTWVWSLWGPDSTGSWSTVPPGLPMESIFSFPLKEILKQNSEVGKL